LERRSRKRFPAKEDCLIILRDEPIRPWQVLDISEEGLAFRYIGGAEDAQSISQLDILTRNTALCIEKIPFQVISDLEMTGPGPGSYSFRRCSGRFGQLTPEQIGQMGTLIKAYTIPGA
jgi:hypothetical protein